MVVTSCCAVGQNIRYIKTLSSRTARLQLRQLAFESTQFIVAFYSDAGRTSHQSGGTDRPWTACDMGGRLLRRHIQKVVVVHSSYCAGL